MSAQSWDWQALYLDEHTKNQRLIVRIAALEGLLARRHTLDPVEVADVLNKLTMEEVTQ